MDRFASFVGLLILVACVGAWVHAVHPEVYQSALAKVQAYSGGAPATNQIQTPVPPPPPAATTTTAQVTAIPAPVAPTPPPSPAHAVVESTGPLVFIPPNPLPAQPNWTWMTTDGKVYKNVVIKMVEADCVTVIDEDGGGRIEIALLPPDIQKLLNYNPALAKRFNDQRIKDDELARAAEAAKKQAMAQQAAVAAQAQAAANLQNGQALTRLQNELAAAKQANGTADAPKEAPDERTQAELNIQSAQEEADRKGQIANYNAEIAEVTRDMDHLIDQKEHDPMDFNQSKFEDVKDKLRQLKSDLATLMTQEAEFNKAHSESSP